MEEKVLTEEERKQRREDRRKRKKYRLLILLLLMFGTGVMLATSTYAWFTSNKTVTVNSITTNIEAKGGIQISTDGTKWKSIINTTDITGAHATYSTSVNQLPGVLEPVSTGGVVDANGRLPMYYGTVDTNADGDYIITAVTATETESNGDDIDGKFIAFDLFFKVEKQTDIFLTPTSGVRIQDDTTDTGIKNASRIAFIELGNTTSGDTVANIQALNNKAASPIHIWEPNYDSHTPAGIANARDVYGKNVSDNSGTADTYSGIIAGITAENNILLGNATAANNAEKFKDVTIEYKTKNGTTDYLPIFSLKAGVTKVRIYMWVEGQDVDCENNASGGRIKFDLQITTENPNAP